MSDEFERLIHAELDGEITPAERERLAALIEGDAALAEEARAYRQLGEILAAVPAVPAPTGFTNDVMRVVVSPPSPQLRLLRGASWLAAAAVLVVAVAIAANRGGAPDLDVARVEADGAAVSAPASQEDGVAEVLDEAFRKGRDQRLRSRARPTESAVPAPEATPQPAADPAAGSRSAPPPPTAAAPRAPSPRTSPARKPAAKKKEVPPPAPETGAPERELAEEDRAAGGRPTADAQPEGGPAAGGKARTPLETLASARVRYVVFRDSATAERFADRLRAATVRDASRGSGLGAGAGAAPPTAEAPTAKRVRPAPETPRVVARLDVDRTLASVRSILESAPADGAWSAKAPEALRELLRRRADGESKDAQDRRREAADAGDAPSAEEEKGAADDADYAADLRQQPRRVEIVVVVVPAARPTDPAASEKERE